MESVQELSRREVCHIQLFRQKRVDGRRTPIREVQSKIKDGFNSEMICGILEDFWCYKVSEYEGTELKSLDDAGKLYEEIISTGLMIETEEVLRIGDFDQMLGYIPLLSMELNYMFGEYFFPIYISTNFSILKIS